MRTVSLDSQADGRINDKRRAELGNWKGSDNTIQYNTMFFILRG